MPDNFRGDNANLIRSAEALLELDAANALAPHGIGGHARSLLEALCVRLAQFERDLTPVPVLAEGELRACPFCDGLADWQDAGFGEPEWVHLTCNRCCASSGASSDRAKAIRAWNTRTPSPLIDREAVIEECAKAAERVGNFGDYTRNELTSDYGQPRFDLMHAIAAAIRALATSEGRV